MAGSKNRGSNTGMMPTLSVQSDSHNGSERRTNDGKNRTHGYSSYSLVQIVRYLILPATGYTGCGTVKYNNSKS